MILFRIMSNKQKMYVNIDARLKDDNGSTRRMIEKRKTNKKIKIS